MSRIPQNGEEAAYASLALVEALIDALIVKGIIDRNDASNLLRDAIGRLRGVKVLVEHSTQGRTHARRTSSETPCSSIMIPTKLVPCSS